jgi:hypothetical protein
MPFVFLLKVFLITWLLIGGALGDAQEAFAGA